MGKKRSKAVVVPRTEQATQFLKGQASQIFKSVAEKDDVLVVNKHSTPHVVIISYERYKQLKEEGANI